MAQNNQLTKILLKKGADVHAHNDYAICWAAQSGYTETVRLLLENWAGIHVGYNFAIRLAEKNNHTETVELLKQFAEQSVS